MAAAPHFSHRNLNGLGDTITALFAPVAGHDDVGVAGLIEQILGLAIRPRRIVWVRTLHGHAVRLSLGSHGQLFAPTAVIMVAELGPVQRAQDNGRFVIADQHDAKGRKWVGDTLSGWVPARAEGMTEWGRDITIKRADVDHGSVGCRESRVE